MKGYTALTIALLLCSTTYIKAQTGTATTTTTTAGLTSNLPTNCEAGKCIQCDLSGTSDTAGSAKICAKSQIAVVGDTKKNNCSGSGLLDGCLATQMNAAGTAECIACNLFEGYFASKGTEEKPTECVKCDMVTQFFDKEKKACAARTTKSSGTVCKTQDYYKDACTSCNNNTPIFEGQCTTLSNCFTASELAKCGTCFSKHYADENGKCQQCPANTSACTSATSFTCLSTAYKTDDGKSCVACGANAATCTKTGITVCKTGFYLKDKACTACDSSMASCDGSGNAITCKSGYYKNGTKCDQSGVANCKIMTGKEDCRYCNDNFYPTNSLTKCSAFSDSNCAEGTFNEAGGQVCTKCKTGYFLVKNGSSTACGKLDAQCKTPTAATGVEGKCTACNAGYYLVSTGNNGAGSCSACGTGVATCDKDKALTCTAAAEVINGKNCETKSTHCLNVAANKCTLCADGYVALTSDTNNNFNCQSCISGNTTDPADAVLTCSAPGVHLTCADGGFLDGSTCKSCATTPSATPADIKTAGPTTGKIKTCTYANSTYTITKCIQGRALSGTGTGTNADCTSAACEDNNGGGAAGDANALGINCVKASATSFTSNCPPNAFQATGGICKRCTSGTGSGTDKVKSCANMTAEDNPGANIVCQDGYFYKDSTDGCKICEGAAGDGSHTPNIRDKTCSATAATCWDETDLIVSGTDVMKCVAIDAQCKTRSSDKKKCDACNDGYYLNATANSNQGSCNACRTGEATCESATKALTCKAGYILNGNNCDAVANCTTTSQTACTLCNNGFFIKDSKCSACPSNAKTCTDANTPTACNNSYYLDSTTTPATCKACTDTNALTCSATAPITCKATYFLVDKKCTLIGGNCDATSSAKKEKAADNLEYVNCTKCSAGYYINPVKSTCNKLKAWCKTGDATSCAACMNEMENGKVKTVYELNASNNCVVTKRNECAKDQFDNTNKICLLCNYLDRYFVDKVVYTASKAAQTCKQYTLDEIKKAGGSSGYLSAFYAISALFIMIFLR